MKINICIKLDPCKGDHFDPYNRRHYNLMQVGVVDRKPFHRGFCGNFVPHWIRYRGRELLLHGGIDYSYMHDVSPNGFYVVIN